MMFARIISLIVVIGIALPAQAQLDSFAPVAAKALPAVVNISTTQKVSTSPFGGGFGMPGRQQEELEKFFERFGLPFGIPPQGGTNVPKEREVQSLGSGFVIDPKGYVVTNNHVVEQASEIFVIFADDAKLEATLIGRDPKTDLALLKVESDSPLPYVEFGDSDKMRVGDWVMAIGNPFGLGGTVTSGIISARSRNINAGPFDDFLQTDAAINRGNSGGPMFNLDGEVIGVNTAIFSPSGGSVGIGFAIPTAMAKPILEQLREHGRTYRGWLGVKIQHVTEEIADSLGLEEPHGALVIELTEDSPAAKSGIQAGDVILSFKGEKVEEMRMLPRLVASTPVGEKVHVEVLRQGKKKSIKLVLGEFPEEEAPVKQSSSETPSNEKEGELVLGMHLSTVDKAARPRLKLKKDVEGVVVNAVEKDSEAKKRAVQIGDVIVGVNQQDIKSVSDFKQAIKDAKAAERGFMLVRVKRGESSSYITLPVEEK